MLSGLTPTAEGKNFNLTGAAWTHGLLGEYDRAFAYLERAYGARDFYLIFLNADPAFDSLRADPRFAELVRRVGIPSS